MFTPAQESLFLTLGGRALDSRLPRPFLGDTMADEVLGKTGYDLGKFPGLSPKMSKVFDIAVRTKRLDEVVRRFVADHPDAVVLDLGAGLDTRIMRVDPPPTVGWYDIDFPEVVVVRQQVLPEQVSAHSLGADLTDPNWLHDVPTGRPTVIVGDGLVGFLPQEAFVALLNRLTGNFPSGELAFNHYTTYAVRAVKRMRSTAVIAGGVVNPGFNDPHEPEQWAARLRLVEEIFLTRAPEVAECSLLARLGIQSIGRSAALSRIIGTVVLRYSF
ncbi:class I SAM-dependent methyltransferase [Nocardia sp. NPDC052112]|uniref:class I SAM-dependent methyltransferase n=1 Tax=Nocardia sp. NPDC052112 TaxID=3155646 RepID=UPI00343794FB